MAMSPLFVRDLVIAHVGGHDSGALRAFEASTGSTRWSWNGDGPGYASPILVTLSGVEQVVTQTQQYIVSVAPDDGRLLWRMPFTTAYDQNSVTPVQFEESLIFSGHQKSTFALRVSRQGTEWKTQQAWSNSDLTMYMSSPVLRGPWLFGFSEKRRGTLFCLDARDGEAKWVGPGRQGNNAALVLAGESLLAQTTEGELLVTAAEAGAYRPLAQYRIAGRPTWAHPAVTGSDILVKDATHLTLWSLDT
jgi:outer membrane protein assembly factor BamB